VRSFTPPTHPLRTLSLTKTLRQPGQTSVAEVKKSDLRTELLAAEAESRAKKRKAAGLPVEDESSVVPIAAIEDEEAKKRRKVLQEALEMDKDADSDDDGDGDDDDDADGAKGGEAKCVAHCVFFFIQLRFVSECPLIEQWRPCQERQR
jgi:Cwf15/Cwc15 cell cycle control protein